MRVRPSCALWIIGALVCVAPAAFAQGPSESGKAISDTPLTPEESAILSNALIFDPAMLATPPKKPLHLPGSPDSRGYDVKRTEKPDGSSTVVVKQPLPTEWDSSVGADLRPTNTNASGAFDRPLQSTRDNFAGGSAWASIGVPNIGSVDARVDPSNEQGKLGTTLKQSIPFAGRFAVTLQDTYSVTETLAQPLSGPDMPMMALPPSSNPMSPQVFSNERAVKFNILPTGTTLGAGTKTVSNDPVTHNALTAEQKLYGPLQVTTAVTDVGLATSNKSISAGFKLHW
ncbi:MAG TPA: hypothetical protein VEH78_06705 [Pseudolabrys sp.]|nr:hypothetical protein [Pseudolabrys sp.]